MPLLIESVDFEEWYQEELTCDECGALFMYADGYPRYCPYCGLSFKGVRRENETEYFLGDHE